MLSKPPLVLAFLAAASLPNLVQLTVKVQPDSDPEKWNEAEWGPRGKAKCYETIVRACCICHGTRYETVEYMGGSWYDSVKLALEADISGYLNQMLAEVVTNLLKQVPMPQDGANPTKLELHRLQQLLDDHRQRTYEYGEQQTMLKVPDAGLLDAAQVRLPGNVFQTQRTGEQPKPYSGGSINNVLKENGLYKLLYTTFGATSLTPRTDEHLWLDANQLRELLVSKQVFYTAGTQMVLVNA